MLQLLAPLLFHREERQRERREELLGAVVVDDQCLPRPGDRGRGERGEAAIRCPGAGVPRGADRAQRALERRSDAAVEPLDPARLEVEAPGLDGLDREAVVLETANHDFPLLFHRHGVALDQDELRAGGERLAETHAGTHPARLGGGGHGPEERLGPGQRRERRRLQPHARHGRAAPPGARTLG